MPIMETTPLPAKAAFKSATHLQAEDNTGLHEEHRLYARRSVESCRPVAIRRLDADRKPCGLWFLSDIMDVSEGGMCLLASDDHAVEVGQWLLIDLRNHPSFGQLRIKAQLRWFVMAHFALIFGVAFEAPLAKIPTLAVERRSIRRDPNLEEWALNDD
jgi:hypothetical protein